MKISEAALASGASPRALRLYEDEGLILPGRFSNGYRDYCESTIDRVVAVRRLLDAGLPVRFVKRVLPMVVGDDSTIDRQALEEIAAYRERLTERIASLERQRSALGDFLARHSRKET